MWRFPPYENANDMNSGATEQIPRYPILEKRTLAGTPTAAASRPAARHQVTMLIIMAAKKPPPGDLDRRRQASAAVTEETSDAVKRAAAAVVQTKVISLPSCDCPSPGAC